MTPTSPTMKNSLRKTPKAGERRGAARTLTTYRLVEVEHEHDAGLARCRNISNTGLKLDTRMQVAVGQRLEVAFSPSIAIAGRIAWCRGSECGVAFDQTIDCDELLRRSSDETHAQGAREPRLRTRLPAAVIVDGQLWTTEVSDVSQHGMKVANRGHLKTDQRLWVILDCGVEKAAVVRWARDGHAGLLLLDPFSVEDLGSLSAFELDAEGPAIGG